MILIIIDKLSIMLFGYHKHNNLLNFGLGDDKVLWNISVNEECELPNINTIRIITFDINGYQK